jgi:hypothetical protein
LGLSARSRSIQPCRATPFASRVVASRVMHRRDLYRRGVPLRERDSLDARGLAGRSGLFASSFHLARPAALLGSHSGPSQVCSRKWVSHLHFWRSGPRVGSHARVSTPIYFRRGDSSPKRKVQETSGVRLLGFDSHLRSAFFSATPKKRSCLGLCLLQGLPDACLRKRTGSTPIESSASGIPRPAV